MRTDRLPNALVSAFPEEVKKRLLPDIQLVSLSAGQLLHDQDQSIGYIYFPTSAVISMRNVAADGRAVETALQGNEGLVGLAPLLGMKVAVARAITHVGGEALRIQTQYFQAEVDRNSALLRLVQRYVCTVLRQVMRISGCNAIHSVRQRFARRLLMESDSTHRTELLLTHELLGEILGVRRPTITLVAQALENANVVSYVRGRLKILDRTTLEAMACSCYWTLSAPHFR